jgi:C1A family cysteine protease
MKRKLNIILTLFVSIALVSTMFFSSCDPGTEEQILTTLGWLFSDENPETIPDDINLSTAYGDDNLPASVDLTQYFPPIGNQGQYGTCVAWAVGYNLRSFMFARVNNLTTSDMTDDSKVFSPKDLFLAIPSEKRGADCNGTTFQAALDVIVSRGIARMDVVPYTNLGSCTGSVQTSWTENAGNYKILDYRQIDQTVENIKRYLYQGKAIVFGAKLGDEFMNAYGDVVISSQTYNYTGQHAYHAMILCGYDDSKGSAGAFKVINSWGTDWGNSGFIWVDYNYFIQQDYFAFACFIANNIEDEPDLDNPTSGYDLQAWELNDYFMDGYENTTYREASYNVYNTGENALYASDDWNILYLYYNAYDINDYGIVLYDMYTDNYGTYGFYDRPDPIPTDVPAADCWATYIDIPAQTGIANYVSSELFGGSSTKFYWQYEMPALTGYYYLVLVGDGFDRYQEYNEDNNYYFYTYDNGDPLYFISGVLQNQPVSKKYGNKNRTPIKGEPSDFQSVRIGKNKNMYSTKEIRKLIDTQRKSGEMERKVNIWKKANPNVRKVIK